MERIDINSNITNIKNYMYNYIFDFLRSRELEELSIAELDELNNTLVYFNDVLNSKIELQNIKLEGIEKDIRKKLDSMKK